MTAEITVTKTVSVFSKWTQLITTTTDTEKISRQKRRCLKKEIKAEKSRRKTRTEENKSKTRAEISEKSVKNIVYQIRYDTFRVLQVQTEYIQSLFNLLSTQINKFWEIIIIKLFRSLLTAEELSSLDL